MNRFSVLLSVAVLFIVAMMLACSGGDQPHEIGDVDGSCNHAGDRKATSDDGTWVCQTNQTPVTPGQHLHWVKVSH